MEVIITLVLTGMLVMMAGAFRKPELSLWIALAGLITAFCFNAGLWGTEHRYYNDMIVYDNFSVQFNGLILGSVMLVFLLFHAHYSQKEKHLDEISALLLFATTGLLLVTSFGNMTMLFIGIEIVSISLYILAGSRKRKFESNEAAMKYFLMGSFATGVMLLGIALLYGSTGTFDLHELSSFVSQHQQMPGNMFYTGMILLSVGLFFKIAAVPFHFWAPDVYEGSPVVIVSFMASVVKVGAIAAFYRLFAHCFMGFSKGWAHYVIVISVLSFMVAGLVALKQTGFKRMIAYSGISHAGFMLLAVLALSGTSDNSLFLYATSYSMATIALFAVLTTVIEVRHSDDIAEIGGMGRNNLMMAIALIVSLLSMAGIPLLAGFMAKLYLFISIAEAGYIWIVVLAVLASAISLGYYLKPVSILFKVNEIPFQPVKLKTEIRIILIVTTLITFLLGVFPSLIMELK
jgi:NADH-quinone oxidoreductase subunit N